MPVVNRIADYAEEMTAWRRHLHRHPELRFDCQNTAAFIAERLRAFGVDEIHEGIATSGPRGDHRRAGRRPHHRTAGRHGCAADRGS